MSNQQQNINTQPNAEVVTSNYQPILSKNGPKLNPINVYRSTNNNSCSTYLSFGERVEQSPYLVSFENQNNLKTKKKSKKKSNKFLCC